MSKPTDEWSKIRKQVPIFAALGDPTRIMLIQKLSDGSRESISALSEGSRITRQAITKHLNVLQKAGLVRAERDGREMLFQLSPGKIDDARKSLDGISRQWDVALAKLKRFVESDG